MSDLVDALDAALAARGTDIVLRRVTGTAPSTSNTDVTVRAAVRSYQPQELVNGISQTDGGVIVSPTQILAANWPGDGSLPRKLDKIVMAGRVRDIEVVDPIYINDELVRIEMRVLG